MCQYILILFEINYYYKDENMVNTDNINIENNKPLISPGELKSLLPISEKANATVAACREEVKNILDKKDNRLLAIMGPCSIHNVDEALAYAEKLVKIREEVKDKLCVIMRVYFEKPRTTIGWRGLIVDPDLNGSYDMEKGLKTARELLIKINEMGLPVGTEVLDPIVPQYIAELISWSAIGARTTESQTHREITSGLSMPVGFKNSTDGSLEIAVNALSASLHPHSFIGIDQEGRTCLFKSKGNPYGHVILRGGSHGPNYYEECVEDAEELISKINVDPSVIIDCSHANSGKKHEKQMRVLKSVIRHKLGGHNSVVGFMVESNLEAGSQKITDNLQSGVSITDACVGWDETAYMLKYAADHL